MKFSVVRPHSRLVLAALTATTLFGVGLHHWPSVLSWAGDVSLHVVGHLTSRLHDLTLDPLVPAYPRCFSTF